MSMMVNPYAFASPAAGDVVIAAQDFTSGTTTGTISATTTAFGGRTPKAAIILGSANLVANEPGESVDASWSMCITDGASGRHVQSFSNDNGTVTGASRLMKVDNTFNLAGTTSAGTTMIATPSMTTGGISLNVTTGAGTNRRCAFIGFSGDDVQAAIATVNLGTGTSALDVNTIGFQPTAVIAIGACTSSPATVTNLQTTLGFATAEGSQRTVISTELSGNATGAPLQAILSNRIGGKISTAGALNYHLTISDFDSSGFSITPSASAGGDSLLCLALRCGSRRAKIIDFTTPTSTGTATITGVGFKPQAAIAILTNLEGVDPTFSISTSALMSGLSICLIAEGKQWCASTRIDSGVETTDTATQFKAAALVGASNADCDAITATLTSFDNDGLTLNYTAVQGTGKKGFMVCFE
jgi:hypothetical protein